MFLIMELLRNEFKCYPSYTSITWVGAVYALKTAKVKKNRELFLSMLYEYNVDSY